MNYWLVTYLHSPEEISCNVMELLLNYMEQHSQYRNQHHIPLSNSKRRVLMIRGILLYQMKLNLLLKSGIHLYFQDHKLLRVMVNCLFVQQVRDHQTIYIIRLRLPRSLNKLIGPNSQGRHRCLLKKAEQCQLCIIHLGRKQTHILGNRQ